MRDRRCPMCRQMADRLRRPHPKLQPRPHVQQELPDLLDDEYAVLVLNGPRQGERLRVVVDHGEPIATVAEEVAYFLANTHDHTSIYYDLDRDPIRVKVSVNGNIIKDASYKIPEQHRDDVEVTIDARGCQYLLQKLRDSGHAPLADLLTRYGQQELAGTEGEGNLFCYTYSYGDLLQKNLHTLLDVHIVRGSGGTDNHELQAELVVFFSGQFALDPTALLAAFVEEFQ